MKIRRTNCFVRRPAELNQVTRIGPLKEGSDQVKYEEVCPVCLEKFQAGETLTVVPIGPGKDAEARECARDFRGYNAVGLEAHIGCVTGRDERPPPEFFVRRKE